ncbi:MAG TPA: tetratricopeptide repeat protein [Tepidisphaeraceae bacterium]|nr:tetratricopeptide repeat protein [Tepidisphaeraceae bacterium]
MAVARHHATDHAQRFDDPNRSRLNQLWQVPLLLLSLGLFGYAAYLFVDPKPGLTVDDKVKLARTYLKHGRPEAALEQFNRLLETEKLDRDREASVHLGLAEALEAAQRQKRIDVPANHVRIIEQTRIALAQGAKPDADIYRRLGESYEALAKPAEALDNYRKASALDRERSIPLQKKVIQLQLAADDNGPAEASIDEYLRLKDITDAERAWAVTEKAQLLIDRNEFAEAKALLAQALRLDGDPVNQGVVNYRLGYCSWKLGDVAVAERLLRVARELLKVQHPLDADAAYALGRLHQDKGDARTAYSFYRDVLATHPDARVAPLARLGRGVCRVLLGEDEAGLTDLHDLSNEIAARETRKKFTAEVVAGFQAASTALSDRGNHGGALEVLAYEQLLTPDPAAGFFNRLARVYEGRAEQLDRSAAPATAAERIKRATQVRDLRTKAGDAYVAYSRALTLTDDKGYADAMWKGIDLYDRAANLQAVIASLDLFVAERPQDAQAPDALLRLGRAYQAAGMFDKAVAAFQRNQFRYPQSLAASKSAVPLAQAYVAKGPESYAKAESVLRSVVDNNPLLTPEAEEFKTALFELAQLYYRTGRFEEAVGRLEELTQRYPSDAKLGQLLFLMADSYRKSANLLDVRLALATKQTGPAAAVDYAEAQAAKGERLGKARGLFDRVIDLYRDGGGAATDTDRLYQRLAHFYRADCHYDLGNYDDAIKAYDAAAFRYQEDPSALAAYVQIVNSYCALGKVEEAKTANERAKWLLRRMPQESFTDGSFAMPKAYWEQWLKWTSTAGMW